jgi:carboxyl-terminal processing protease
VLRIRDLGRLAQEALAEDLGSIRSKGGQRLLVDLRNVADTRPRDAVGAADLFVSGALLRLRDRAGQVVEELDGPRSRPVWTEPVTVLLNGFTAGSAEALTRALQAEGGARVLGEASYGLGSEPKLFELEDGAGLVLSAAVWETASGARWNGDGVQPDQVIHGRGNDVASVFSDQLNQALDWLEAQSSKETPNRQES